MRRVVITMCIAGTAISACGQSSSQALSDATQSCANNLALPPGGDNLYVPYAPVIPRPQSLSVAEVTALKKSMQARARLAAAAAAKDRYWQPLADAWAIQEARLNTLEGVFLASTDGAEPDFGPYQRFLDDVNVSYATIMKDTYCRVAINRSGITIQNP